MQIIKLGGIKLGQSNIFYKDLVNGAETWLPARVVAIYPHNEDTEGDKHPPCGIVVEQIGYHDTNSGKDRVRHGTKLKQYCTYEEMEQAQQAEVKAKAFMEKVTTEQTMKHLDSNPEEKAEIEKRESLKDQQLEETIA